MPIISVPRHVRQDPHAAEIRTLRASRFRRPPGPRLRFAGMSRKRPLTERGVRKLSAREREADLDPDDAAARWLEEHDRKPDPPQPMSTGKSKELHRWRQRRLRGE